MKRFVLAVVLFAVASAAPTPDESNNESGSHKYDGKINWDLQGSNSHSITQAFEGMIKRLQERLKELGVSSSSSGNYHSAHESQGKVSGHIEISSEHNRQKNQGVSSNPQEIGPQETTEPIAM